jgi:3-phosphoshikimate 1-carboxyvinyltransferase
LRVRRSPGFVGEMTVPGDKSITHRALILGALAEGETRVSGWLDAADCRSTWACLQALGVGVRQEGADLVVSGGGPEALSEPPDVLDCGNSGTSMRLLLGLLAGLPGLAVLTGDASLRRRPMDRVAEPLRRLGARIDGRGGGRLAPVVVRGGGLRCASLRTPVASAQVKSAILLAGLQAEGRTEVEEPALSRDHTERMLEGFGARLSRSGLAVALEGGQRLRGCPVDVPGDISAAAFFLAAAAMVPGSRLTVRGVGVNPTRTGVLDVLEAMGAGVRLDGQRLAAGEPVADVTVTAEPLHGVRIGGQLIPRLIDELPVLAVAAAVAAGPTEIRDAAELRVKESDRVATIAAGLRRLGASVEELPDGLRIEGSSRLRGAEVAAAADHRIAMAMAVAGLVADGETVIDGAEAVAISFPGFAEALASWG